MLDPLEHRGRVLAARFSPDGAMIATPSEDGAARALAEWSALAAGCPCASSTTCSSSAPPAKE